MRLSTSRMVACKRPIFRSQLDTASSKACAPTGTGPSCCTLATVVMPATSSMAFSVGAGAFTSVLVAGCSTGVSACRPPFLSQSSRRPVEKQSCKPVRTLSRMCSRPSSSTGSDVVGAASVATSGAGAAGGGGFGSAGSGGGGEGEARLFLRSSSSVPSSAEAWSTCPILKRIALMSTSRGGSSGACDASAWVVAIWASTLPEFTCNWELRAASRRPSSRATSKSPRMRSRCASMACSVSLDLFGGAEGSATSAMASDRAPQASVSSQLFGGAEGAASVLLLGRLLRSLDKEPSSKASSSAVCMRRRTSSISFFSCFTSNFSAVARRVILPR
mmetsp:Transcript_126648/g.270192  ORF Transcript_126648/g.270192 Transcript_126648/m.270192 type:complete len:332 (-) Transcript_126648:823-1818(-)